VHESSTRTITQTQGGSEAIVQTRDFFGPKIEGTETRLDQATALIISDDPEFSRVVMDRWQGERNAPAFTLMSADVCRDLDADGFDLAIVGSVRPAGLPSVFNALTPSGKPVLFVSKDKLSAGEAGPQVRILQQREGWLDALVLVSAEILRLGQASTAEVIRPRQTSDNLTAEKYLGPLCPSRRTRRRDPKERKPSIFGHFSLNRRPKWAILTELLVRLFSLPYSAPNRGIRDI